MLWLAALAGSASATAEPPPPRDARVRAQVTIRVLQAARIDRPAWEQVRSRREVERTGRDGRRQRIRLIEFD